ncbi:unnamed protein product [Rotaria sordida]|uniref:SUEL-type lectin domain-containing protein n=1 Tax=Rotaria sordida TaxID=392033 RepID=A0A813V3G3_9BILA|nr:unnamed protein product [Rotaria sordida]CAF3610554.1 unnamed protein product [Rotaria sordida]
MDNQDNSINNDHHNDENEEVIPSMTAIGEGDTYPISDSESTTDVMPLIDTNVIQDEEQGELNQSNIVQLRLRCSLYEHIEIIRVIYGYSKQRSINQCQFSIYDCIQEGSSRNILSCNGKQTCFINLTKNEIFSTTITTHGVPACSDFNYVQVNFGCVLDAKDICDSWKDEGTIIHLSHTRSKDKQYNECQCKVRSSLSNGQVLLHAREINRQFANLEDLRSKKDSNTDCKSTTYLEINTDRSERKCMDNLPSNGNALFGSGSHNFTLNYVRNDPLSELFFYFELKASPVKNDHYVQIICNWARRTTTIRTTVPMTTRKRKITTINMSDGLKLSRLDLIRHPLISENEINNHNIDEDIDISLIDNNDETETTIMNNEYEVEEDEEKHLTTNSIIKQLKSKIKKKIKTSTTILLDSKTTGTPSISNHKNDDDDEWSHILSMAGIDSLSSSSEQFFLFNNDTFINSAQASILSNEENSRYKMSKNKFLIICLLMIFTIIFILSLYCLKVKQSGFIRRLKININVALLFCCEASKLLFSSSNHTNSLSSTSTNTMTRHQQSLSVQIGDYRSSEYYTNDPGNNFHTTESIYDYDGGGKSIYSIDDYDDDQPQQSAYITQYDRYSAGDTC